MAAFECFDEQDEGKIDAGELRYWLSEVGDRMKDEEVRSMAVCEEREERSDRPPTDRPTAFWTFHGSRWTQFRLQGL